MKILYSEVKIRKTLSVEERRSILAKVMPIIRGAVSDEKENVIIL